MSINGFVKLFSYSVEWNAIEGEDNKAVFIDEAFQDPKAGRFMAMEEGIYSSVISFSTDTTPGLCRAAS